MPSPKVVDIQWCSHCVKWCAVTRAESSINKPCPCPFCHAIMNKTSSDPKANPYPCIHIQQVLHPERFTASHFARVLNKYLPLYPQQSTWKYGDFADSCTLLTIDTPRKCHICQHERKEDRLNKAIEKRRRQWTKYYMEEHGMTKEEAEDAVYEAEQDAQGEAHEAWVASLDPNEHPWTENPD